MTELQQQGTMDDRRTNRDTTPPKPSPLLKDATPPPENLPAIPESPKTPKSPQVGREREGGVREKQIIEPLWLLLPRARITVLRVQHFFFLQSDPSRRHRVTPSRSSSKRKSNPYSEAVSLARHLYMLDGYKKSEVAGKLADP